MFCPTCGNPVVNKESAPGAEVPANSAPVVKEPATSAPVVEESVTPTPALETPIIEQSAPAPVAPAAPVLQEETQPAKKKRGKAVPIIVLILILLLLGVTAALFWFVPSLHCMVWGHEWKAATCVTAKTCERCGEEEGKALGHDWTEADCVTAKTCKVCNEVEGSALGHTWTEATCEVAKTCSTCGAVEGNALGHTWEGATCFKAKYCSTCGQTSGSPLSHQLSDYGYCSRCNQNYPVNFSAGNYKNFLTVSIDWPSDSCSFTRDGSYNTYYFKVHVGVAPTVDGRFNNATISYTLDIHDAYGSSRACFGDFSQSGEINLNEYGYGETDIIVYAPKKEYNVYNITYNTPQLTIHYSGSGSFTAY